MASYQYIYVMKDLSKAYGNGKKVLDGVTLSFLPGAKIGILGPNGAGKSTLLKIMAGIDKDYMGEAWAADGAKVGYLEQEPQLDSKKNVQENVMDGLREIKDMVDRYNAVSAEMADPDADFDALMAEMGELQEKSTPQTGGNLTARLIWRWRLCVARRVIGRLKSYQVVKNAVLRWRVCCWKNLICCCWMNRQTT